MTHTCEFIKHVHIVHNFLPKNCENTVSRKNFIRFLREYPKALSEVLRINRTQTLTACEKYYLSTIQKRSDCVSLTGRPPFIAARKLKGLGRAKARRNEVDVTQ